MARVDHTFTMAEPPDRALVRFQSEVGPALRKAGGFRLADQAPGQLHYSDGIVAGWTLRGHDVSLYSHLRRLSARHLRIEFAAEGGGSRVRVRGSALRDVARDIEVLGRPDIWPRDSAAPPPS